MSRPPAIRAYLDADEIVVDNFAGGGGASTGIVAAIGRGNAAPPHPVAAVVRANVEVAA